MPDSGSRAAGLGILNIGLVVPSMLGALLAAALIGVGGYVLLYVVAAIVAALGGALVCRVRAVR